VWFRWLLVVSTGIDVIISTFVIIPCTWCTRFNSIEPRKNHVLLYHPLSIIHCTCTCTVFDFTRRLDKNMYWFWVPFSHWKWITLTTTLHSIIYRIVTVPLVSIFNEKNPKRIHIYTNMLSTTVLYHTRFNSNTGCVPLSCPAAPSSVNMYFFYFFFIENNSPYCIPSRGGNYLPWKK